MKRFFVCFAMFIAMVLMTACGGSDSGSSSSSESNNQECTPGDFECEGSESYYCNSRGSWVYDARCENGCDDSTGRCYSDSGDSSDSGSGNDNTDSGDSSDSGNNNDHGDSADSGDNNDHGDSGSTSECTTGKYKCENSYSYYCSDGLWDSGKQCPYSCNSSTGECYSDDSSCSSGDSKCVGSVVYSCGSDGTWEFKETCEYGCGYSTSTAKCQSPECSSGERKCDKNIYVCKDGFWKVDDYCSHGCDSSTLTCKHECYKIEGKIWSESYDLMDDWYEATDYCENLTECGYSDWRLPTINELRTLIQNCPATQTGGECKVTDSCLSDSECYTYDDCSIGCYDGIYSELSKLGDDDFFWSSSTDTDNTDRAWGVYFISASVYSLTKSLSMSQKEDCNARCVR